MITFELEDYEDEQLVDELEARGYYVYEDKQKDYEDVLEEVENSNYIIKRNYDGNDLREHLIEILQCGHYHSGTQLLELLNNTLKS